MSPTQRLRLCGCILLELASAAAGAADTSAAKPVFPLWDGKESVADYAKRVNLSPTETLDLGGGVKMDLVLIPAGKFIMGTPKPEPVKEAEFHKQIVIGKALLTASTIALLVMLAVVLGRAVRQKRRPQLSLALLMLVTLAAGGCVLSGLHWRRSENILVEKIFQFKQEEAQYKAAEPNEKPAHLVTLTQPYYMGQFPVTQAQYEALIGINPSRFIGKNNPVESVSWEESEEFCKRLAAQTNEIVRLPTEAEWEYGCRAGTKSRFYSGDSEADLARVAWYDANSKDMTHPVGQKEPNTFGLYDMHGNVEQWCQDWYMENYYHAKSQFINPKGPEKGVYCLIRGGEWACTPDNCRSARRTALLPFAKSIFVGFRIVMELSIRTP